MDGSNIFVRIVHFDIKVKIKGYPKINYLEQPLIKKLNERLFQKIIAHSPHHPLLQRVYSRGA